MVLAQELISPLSLSMWNSPNMSPTVTAPAGTKNLGMTGPISTAAPEPRDLELAQKLEESLRSVLLFFQMPK